MAGWNVVMMAGGIESEIKKIKERNARVEADKAWELSKTRRLIIAVFIYLLAAVALVGIRAPDPFANALIPVVGFWFSTLTLPFFKEFWIKRIYKK